MRTIVVSAINIRKGGTLTILRSCLEYLSARAMEGDCRVVALVHRRDLAEFPCIEYMEFPHSIRSWVRRLWYEYVTMHGVSRSLAPVDLWLSLHDTTPRVEARRQAVYCQTSFPFLRWKWSDLKYDYKIVLFALFTRLAYGINIRRNRYLIVQAEWLREGFAKMFSMPAERFIVFPPRRIQSPATKSDGKVCGIYTFLFAATADVHKNFETLCSAARLLEKKLGSRRFAVVLTIDGTENRYARFIRDTYADVASIRMVGFLPKARLLEWYRRADCMVFPSRMETWGLPISEFAPYGKPMLLADLPYAREAAAGGSHVAFFDTEDVAGLAARMERLILVGNDLTAVTPMTPHQPHVQTWAELFDTLLNDDV